MIENFIHYLEYHKVLGREDIGREELSWRTIYITLSIIRCYAGKILVGRNAR